jgi:hypothetical protein
LITEQEMIPVLLEADPSCQTIWEEFLKEWKDEKEEPPLYIFLANLARQLINKLECGNTDNFASVFEVVERWHKEGDTFVKEAAIIGFLESLQNSNLHSSTKPEQFVEFLLPESLRFWRKVTDFFEKGKIITND